MGVEKEQERVEEEQDTLVNLLDRAGEEMLQKDEKPEEEGEVRCSGELSYGQMFDMDALCAAIAGFDTGPTFGMSAVSAATPSHARRSAAKAAAMVPTPAAFSSPSATAAVHHHHRSP